MPAVDMATRMKIGSHLARDLGGAFTVLTGISFVSSALIQEAVFWWWGLDFTAIASIEDVILGGIRFLSLAIIGGLAALPFLIAIVAGFYETKEPVRRKGKTETARIVIRTIFVTFIFIIIAIFFYLMNFHPEFSSKAREFGEIKVRILSMFFIGLSLLSVVLLTSNHSNRIYHAALEGKYFIIMLFSFSMALAGFNFYATNSYPNISITPNDSLPATCQHRHGGFHSIKWIGSRAVVIACPERIYVIRGDQSIRFAMRR